MLFNLKIIGAEKNEFLINVKDLISIADLSFRVKYDSAEKISWAINEGKLYPLYFHKMIKENEQDEEKMLCYPFHIDLDYKLIYFLMFDHIFFLKRHVEELESEVNHFSFVDDIAIPPLSRTTSENSILPILKKTIKLSGITSKFPVKNPFELVCYIAMLISIRLYCLIITNGFISYFTNSYKYKITNIEGYSPDIIKENYSDFKEGIEEDLLKKDTEPFNLKEYMKEYPNMTVEEKEALVYELYSFRGFVLEEIGKAINFDNPFKSTAANKQDAFRMKENHKKRLEQIKRKKASKKIKNKVVTIL